ncbi:MAG: peroxide stress protein YaaA [Streptosporangiaceae bacterium]
MLILLPPSEGKAPAGAGPPVDLASLTLPVLSPVRLRVLKALVRLCRGREATARAVLGLSERQSEAVVGNQALLEAPALRAAELYTGVLYDNLRLTELDGAALKRAEEQILIFSGLWGVLGINDRVPPYRLAMGVKLPRQGPLAGVWRPALTRALKPQGLVVDMRSAPYAAAWKGRSSVGVRVLREQVVDGVAKRSVVSHLAKATRGAVARDLLVHGVEADTPQELASALAELGYSVEVRNGTIEVMIRD